jgi:hypothetical protein
MIAADAAVCENLRYGIRRFCGKIQHGGARAIAEGA